MTSEEAKAEVANLLCQRFANLREATRRHDLVVKVKNPQILMEMEQATLCRSQDNQKTYLPTAGSFALIADKRLADRARLATLRTIQTLQKLFEANERDEPYTFSDLEEYAGKIFDDLDLDAMRLGLYLSVDFGALGSCTRSANGAEIESFMIPEHILSMEDPSRNGTTAWIAPGTKRKASCSRPLIRNAPLSWTTSDLLPSREQRIGIWKKECGPTKRPLDAPSHSLTCARVTTKALVDGETAPVKERRGPRYDHQRLRLQPQAYTVEKGKECEPEHQRIESATKRGKSGCDSSHCDESGSQKEIYPVADEGSHDLGSGNLGIDTVHISEIGRFTEPA